MTELTPKHLEVMFRQLQACCLHDPVWTPVDVDREVLERDGEVIRRSGHWWEDDFRLFAELDAAEAHIGTGRHAPRDPDLAQLKQEMAAAHPDRGGTAEKFMAARGKYERAARAAATA